jgi:hypothetical protein
MRTNTSVKSPHTAHFKVRQDQENNKTVHINTFLQGNIRGRKHFVGLRVVWKIILECNFEI